MIKNNKARSFVTLMIIIAVSALLLRIGLEQVIKISMEQNGSNAQTNLKYISTALENYAKDNNGVFPESFSMLTLRYLDKDYIKQSPIKGYNYRCSKLDASGYNCSAAPVRCNLSGVMSYAVTTGGLFVSEDCLKKEKE